MRVRAWSPAGTGSFVCLAAFDLVDLRKPLSEEHMGPLLIN